MTKFRLSESKAMLASALQSGRTNGRRPEGKSNFDRRSTRKNFMTTAGGGGFPRLARVMTLVVLMLTGFGTGAWAQTETLLTTITPTAKTTYSETTAGVVTVTPSGQAGYYSTYGWLWGTNSGSVTVEAKEGYTITKCVFKQNDKTPVTITTSPFAITFANGDCVQNDDMDGVASIEVYGYATPAATGYSVTMAEGTEDADKWTIEPNTGLKGGETVTATYSGEKKVKSVKAVKKTFVTAIELNKTATTIAKGSNETLSITAVTPDNADDKTVTWSSDKENIAIVDANGKVTAVAVGTANITATANDGSGVKATCAVTVTLAYPVALSAVTADCVGSVVCSDGNVYAKVSDATTAGKTAVAMIAYIGSGTDHASYKHGLAIALSDESSSNWSTAKSTCEGKTAVTGAAWLLPSQNQWKAMFNANGGSYSGLNTAITTAGGTALQESNRYWSSKENGGDKAYFVYLSGGDAHWNSYSKDSGQRVRACLAF